jgi:hypothetical protein
MRSKRQSKRLKGRLVRSDATTEDENSPTYQESNDSSSRTSSDDGNDGDDTGGGTTSLDAQGGGHERSLSPFTADQLTHCTQDEHHDVPISSRIPVSEANALVDSSDSSSQWINDLPIPGPYTYHITNIHSQQPTWWVYEWLIRSCITCVIRTGKALLNGPTSHGRNIRHIFFEPKVLCSCRRRSIMQYNMRNQYSGLFICILDYLYVLYMILMILSCVLCMTLMVFIYVYYELFAYTNLVDIMSLFFMVFRSIYRISVKISRFSVKSSGNRHTDF